ncbi:hypothetical protein [Jannaschia pohangensis]|uniref:hypothetical protein n=1 Tax=Jannaschia pohangensis TaxID=390807 RepID=UPI000B2C7E46|nr:hypothetical protein [Jannaschia pohangensis]
MAMTRPLMTLATCALMALGGVAQAQTRTSDGVAVVPVTLPAGVIRVAPGTVSPRAGQIVTGTAVATDGTVVVPAARSTFHVGHPPHGYKAAWDDGRLNPNRGPRTLQGDYQSEAVWTNTTPRERKPVIFVRR